MTCGSPNKPRIGKTDLRDIESLIGDRVDYIQDLLEKGDFDAASGSTHKVLLQTLVDLIPFAEQAVRESKGTKGIYQITTLGSMIMETLNSARVLSDRGQVANVIIDSIMLPAFRQMAESLVQEFMTLASDVADIGGPKLSKELKSTVTDARNRLAQRVQSQFLDINDKIKNHMSSGI